MKLKFTEYEYWPYWLFYAPFVPYWVLKSIQSGSFSYFCKVNPGMAFGGFLDYSKFEILKQIPSEYLPKTRFIIQKSDLKILPKFPFIAKPDMGERGRYVELIRNQKDWDIYPLKKNLIIQEYVDFPFEFGVFYVKPNQFEKGKILSITGKEFLIFNPDKDKNLKDFVRSNPRAIGRKEYFYEKFSDYWEKGPDKAILLEPIGNHNRGTRFFDASELITAELENAVGAIADQIEGFNYGRFDVKSKSVSDFVSGRFMVIEVNGANSEPTHIYDSNFGIFKAYSEVKRHFDFQYRISKRNQKNYSSTKFYKAVLKRMF